MTTDKLNRFFSDISFRLKNFRLARKELDVYLSSEFNVFNFIGPDENRLSDIIADMLDKNGTHGQKDLFLKKLLFIYGLEHKLPAEYDYKVVREYATRHNENSNRRIDITIDLGSFGIGIENKPRACEQPNQVRDYKEQLRKQYNNNYLLLYLSGDGTEPSSIEKADLKNLKNEKKLLTLTYRDNLTAWIKDCRNECNSDKYRWFLKDFMEYIQDNFQQ